MNETRRTVQNALSAGPISGPDLAQRLGISRAAVWKHVEALREEGFTVESKPDGYVLAGVPDYGGPAIEFGLKAPFDIEYHEAIPSTNNRARELASDGAQDVVVVANRQTGGRGRRGREWSSPAGGVWLSIVLRPDIPPARVPTLTLAAAIAVTDAARETGVPANIKWPNDVLVEQRPPEETATRTHRGNLERDEDDRSGRKLAGVLTEMEGEASRVSWVILGVGVNVNVDLADLSGDATSVQAEVGSVDRRVFVQRTLERFMDLRDSSTDILDEWRERAATLGQYVRVETPSEDIVGTAVDVTEYGSLVVETDEDERIVHAGDCEHLRATRT